MQDEIAATLAGRAAEQIVFGNISTGAQNDLDKVTSTAYQMVVIFGMTESVGNVSYYELMKNENFQKPFSDETARKIDEEVKAIIDEQYVRVVALLNEKRESLNKVAQVLLEKEVIVKDDVERLIGKRPFEVEHSVVAEVQNDEAKKEENNVAENSNNNEISGDIKNGL